MPIELKTIDACKDEVAKERGYKNWETLLQKVGASGRGIPGINYDAVIKVYAEHLLDYAAQETNIKRLCEGTETFFKASILTDKDSNKLVGFG